VSEPAVALTIERAAPVRFDGARMIWVAALVQATSTALLGAYAVLQTPLIEEFGADATRLGIGMSLAILAMALAAPLLGPLFDRGPLRQVMLAGVCLMLASVVGLSRGRALWQLALCLPLATTGMSMYGMFPAQVILVNWFVQRRGTALGRAAVGASVGALVVPLATAWLVELFGWRNALLALGFGAAALATPAIALFAVRRPEDVGQSPDGLAVESDAPAPGATGDARPADVRGWLRDPSFWAIAIGAGLALSVSVATLFLVRHLEKLGIERTQAALVPSLMAGCGIVGKLVSGWASDRIDVRAVVVTALWIHAFGWTLVATQSSHAAFLAAAVPLGLGGGGFLPLPAVLQGRCFGRDAIGRVSGLHALLGLPFLLATAPLVGLAEVETGSFRAPFLGLAGVLLTASAVLACVRIPRAPRRAGA
jgi:MFS family permease